MTCCSGYEIVVSEANKAKLGGAEAGKGQDMSGIPRPPCRQSRKQGLPSVGVPWYRASLRRRAAWSPSSRVGTVGGRRPAKGMPQGRHRSTGLALARSGPKFAPAGEKAVCLAPVPVAVEKSFAVIEGQTAKMCA